MEPPEKYNESQTDLPNDNMKTLNTNARSPTNARTLSTSSSSNFGGQSRGRASSVSPSVPVMYRTRSSQISEIEEDSKSVIPKTDVAALKADLDVTWHTTNVDELLGSLGSNSETGISQSYATRRLLEDGPNAIAPAKRNELLHYASFLVSGFCPLLWVAAIMFFLCWRPLGNPNPAVINLAIGILLLIIIGLQAIFSAYQEHSSNKVMSTIYKMLPSFAHIIRDGKPLDVPTAQLVVGDIVDLNIGDKVPADMRLLSVDQMKVDRSMLTGESEPISCSTKCTDNNYLETANLAFLGSNVVEGRGRGVVVATGNRTTMGRITSLAAADSATSQLQKDITRFVLIIAFLSISTGIICIIVWGAWLKHSYPGFMNVAMIITTALSAIVAYVPEGLPVCVTLTLTIVAKHMSKNNALVKSLPTVETLGAVEILASDKTGTLTQNKMTVIHVYRAGELVEVYDNKGLVSKESMHLYDTRDPTFCSLVDIAAMCNRAYWTPETKELPMAERRGVGDASDTALLQFAETYARADIIRKLGPKIAEIPFNSKNKYALSVHEIEGQQDYYAVLIKGAAEQLLDRCATILNAEGKQEQLDQPIKNAILVQQEALCDKGERVLALCRLEVPKSAYSILYIYPGCDLTQAGLPMKRFCFVGMTGLIDPPRPEVKTAVEQCRRAGIIVAMVTGDHPGTAAAIARMVGIITSPQPVTTVANAPKLITPDEMLPAVNFDDVEMQAEFNRPVIVRGTDLPADQNTWDWVLSHKEIVFARTTPEQKLRIVKECQRRGKTVAVTGDGVNDAPALKQADIGIAMGAGSDVAREAADIVLTDNKFSTVVIGISNGRLVAENLKKVILYLLPAGSWSELTPVLANVFLGLPLPLSSFEMIWICIITDVFPSLSLIYEKPESDLISAKADKLVNWRLLVQAYLVTGNLESFFAFLSFFLYMSWYGNLGPSDLFLAFDKWTDGYMGKSQDELNNLLNTAQTVFFVTLVLMQFGNLHSIRTRHLSWFQQNPFKKETRNLHLFGAMCISTILLIIAVYIPGINSLFLTAPIPTEFWFLPLAYGMTLFTLDEIRKFVIRKFPSSFLAWIAW